MSACRSAARLAAPRAVPLLAAALASACVSVPRAVAPRPITFACPSVTPAAFGARGLALLRENSWTVLAADSTTGAVRGARGPVYAGLGEGLSVDGPYRLSTTHNGREASVLVQEVEIHNHRAIPVHNLNDRSSDADRRNFLAVLDGLRAFCGAPTSGRPNPNPPVVIPPA